MLTRERIVELLLSWEMKEYGNAHDVADAILAEMGEPLEKLAARKRGVRCIRTWPYANGGFAVDLDCDDGLHGHEGDTLEQAKAKAREFLNSLEDVK